MTIRSESELNQIVKELEGADYQVADIKKRRSATKKATGAFHYQYHAAGGIESAELCYAENDAYCTAAL